MNPVPFEPDERIFTWSDVRALFVQWRKRLGLTAACVGLSLFGLLFLRAPAYLAEATFKEGVEKSDEGGLKDFLNGFGMSPQQPQAIVLMKSHPVLKPLIERHGLQSCVARRTFWDRLFRRIGDNWRAEQGAPLSELDWFAFADVHYNGERPGKYNLRFTDSEQFELFSEGGDALARGKLNEPVRCEGVEFTCTRAPSKLALSTTYSLTLAPWIACVGDFKSKLKIVSHKTNKAIYELSFEHRDRHLATRLLNDLMEGYRSYLRQERDQVASEQLAYLEQRQTQIYAKLEGLFDEHMAYLKNVVDTKGFLGLKEELESFIEPHETLRSKILGIDVEMSLLNAKRPALQSSELFRTASETVQGLEQQRDLLQLALDERGDAPKMEEQFAELAALRRAKSEMQELQASLNRTWQGVQFPATFGWAQHFSSNAERTDFARYLDNHVRLLGVREKILQDRFTHASGGSAKELQGIDLGSAKKLHLEATQALDFSENGLRKLAHFRRSLEQEEFELSGLSTILSDPFSLELVAKASDLSMKLSDEKYRTDKEAERWKSDLAFYRKILTSHIEQLSSVEEVTASLLREKITALQQLCLDAIHQQLSILHAKMEDLIRERKTALLEEKSVLQEKMAELRKLAADLPERWKLENWLEIKTEMAAKIMQVMTELVESKTVSRHLHHVESKPLDRSITPVLAKPPRLVRLSLIGGILVALSLFFVALIRALFRGFPISLSKLELLRYPVSGSLQRGAETLHRLMLFLDAPGLAGLFGSQGPNYASELARLLARAGERVLAIDVDCLEGAGEPMQTEGVDWLRGRPSLSRMEHLRSKRFQQLLALQRPRYDQILLWSSASLASSEASAMLSLVDRAVVTVDAERTEQLTPFIHWGYHQERCRITFVGSR